MIQIEKLIQLENQDLQTISEIISILNPPNYWDGATGVTTGVSTRRSLLKSKIKNELLKTHHNTCAYCLTYSKNQNDFTIDHFAPKGQNLHPEFCYTPQNLLLCCWTCNNGYKKTKDTIATKNPEYLSCIFNTYHPILHNFSTHFDKDFFDDDDLIAPISEEGRSFFMIFDYHTRYFDVIYKNIRYLKETHTEVYRQILAIEGDRIRISL